MAPPEHAWTDEFRDLVTSGDYSGAIASLDRLRTKHAGTPPQRVKDCAVKIIETMLADEPVRLYDAARAFVTSEHAVGKEVGIILLPAFYGTDTAVINEQFVRVGDDENWEVREWAASALAHVIAGHFDVVYPHLLNWSEHPSPNLRRMVVVAAGYAIRDCTTDQCRRLLDILSPLMADPDVYISKNFGAFALGSYAIRYQVDLVARWAAYLDLQNEQVVCNLAMMFTTAESAKRLDTLGTLLLSLVHDERKAVSRAVKKAVKNLDERNHQGLVTLLECSEASADTELVR